MQWLDKIPWPLLIIVAAFLGLAPFVPEPHLMEKFGMLAQGTLKRPLDIFDLFYHSFPIILLVAKITRSFLLK